jgi:diguanylate cyclase (GGDEF)-like protein
MTRMFVVHAVITLIPVLIVGLVLAEGYRSEARQRGLSEGRSEAVLVARTAIEPILDAKPLRAALPPGQLADLNRVVTHAITERDVLRLRVRNLSGRVLFSDDGSGFNEVPEDEALDAARGQIVERLTHLNSDSNDEGSAGPESVEVYLPLVVSDQQVGVLEVYLPYAPIQADVTAGLHMLYWSTILGLAALYIALFAISLSVSKGLRRQVKENRFLAEHDALTGLANRALFHTRGVDALRSQAATEGRTVIALLDLDRFKEVNDTLGHHSGDELLGIVATRLTEVVGSDASVARLGGDEFGVILAGAADPEPVLNRIRRALAQEATVSGLPISVDSSIGYVVAPEDGTEMVDLLQRADVAMYLAKFDHAGLCRYDPARDHYDAAKLHLVSQLRHAIDAGQLVLHYQPKATVADGSPRAVEALLRWQHPELGLLYPDAFVPLAEQTDLIDKLTAWVMTRALGEIADMGDAVGDLAVAVNISARNLIRPDFAVQVIGILTASGMPAERLIVEITETALLVDPARAATVLGELAAAGVTVSIDDFGIGQTSLSYLATLPVGELKIDKSFVMDMLANPTHAAIVASVVDLGHNLNLRVVAEGVEDAAVLDRLRATGCDLAQGYHIARPMPGRALGEWLRPKALPSAH